MGTTKCQDPTAFDLLRSKWRTEGERAAMRADWLLGLRPCARPPHSNSGFTTDGWRWLEWPICSATKGALYVERAQWHLFGATKQYAVSRPVQPKQNSLDLGNL